MENLLSSCIDFLRLVYDLLDNLEVDGGYGPDYTLCLDGFPAKEEGDESRKERGSEPQSRQVLLLQRD